MAHLGVGLLLPCQVGDLIPNPLTMNEQLKSKSRMPMLMECMSGKQQRPIFNIKHMLIDSSTRGGGRMMKTAVGINVDNRVRTIIKCSSYGATSFVKAGIDAKTSKAAIQRYCKSCSPP